MSYKRIFIMSGLLAACFLAASSYADVSLAIVLPSVGDIAMAFSFVPLAVSSALAAEIIIFGPTNSVAVDLFVRSRAAFRSFRLDIMRRIDGIGFHDGGFVRI